MSQSFNCLIRRVPGLVWLAAGGLLAAAFWMQQHDARIRQQAGLQQLRNQTSAAVAALRKQSAHDVEQANVENAKAIAELEQRREQAEHQNRQLAAQLARLRKQAQIQAGEAAILPISQIVTRVAAQLGLKAEDLAPEENAASRQSAKGQSTAETHTSQRTRRMRHPASAPAVGAETPHPVAGASTLSPRRGPGQPTLADIAKGAASASADGGAPALALTASGARKVETALVALDACRAESGIEGRQFSNCQARAEADESAIERLKGSVASLNQALAAKDKVLAGQQSECKAELRAARGTFLGRLARLTEHLAIGVGVGVAIGVAVK